MNEITKSTPQSFSEFFESLQKNQGQLEFRVVITTSHRVKSTKTMEMVEEVIRYLRAVGIAWPSRLDKSRVEIQVRKKEPWTTMDQFLALAQNKKEENQSGSQRQLLP